MGNYELTGFLHSKSEVEQVTQTFKKREFVVYVENLQNEKYSDYVKFELTQDKCDLLTGFKKDEKVTVYFNIDGRKYEKDGTTRYFNSLKAWKVEKTEATQPPPQIPSNHLQLPNDDDLPF